MPLTKPGPHSVLDPIPSYLIKDIALLSLQHYQISLSIVSFSSAIQTYSYFCHLRNFLTSLLLAPTQSVLPLPQNTNILYTVLYQSFSSHSILNPPTIKISLPHCTKTILVKVTNNLLNQFSASSYFTYMQHLTKLIFLSSLVSFLVLVSSIPLSPRFVLFCFPYFTGHS